MATLRNQQHSLVDVMRYSGPVFPSKLLFLLLSALALVTFYQTGCARGLVGGTAVTPVDGGTGGTTDPPPAYTGSGVLHWKGDPAGAGNYSQEGTLTPANVNVNQFGKLRQFPGDGYVLAQPLYLSKLDMKGMGTHNVVIFATEHNSVFAYDADAGGSSLWERHYNVDGATSAPDNYGGRTTIGGEIGITGTPVIDPSSGIMYFVTMLSRNGAIEQWLRAIDVTTGQDFGPGSVKISASVAGDGRGSVNGQIAFDPVLQNQRPGLTMAAGKVIIAWGSFSDWGVYHGWVMAYDPKTLTQSAVFNTATQFQAVDDANGPADHGGGASIWMGGASPSVDSDGNIYLVASDGSFNANTGGANHGDSVLKLKFDGSSFSVADYFTPSNQACINAADLEIGSGGVSVVDVNGRRTGIVINKEGRMYVLDLNNMGKYNPGGDQVPQVVMVGSKQCFDGMGTGFAEGPDWQRLYANPSVWNGNVYVGASSAPLKQYAFSGGTLNAVAQSGAVAGMRGWNTVVSSNGAQNGIVWGYTKNASEGRAELHAYDATNISHELWNSSMNSGRDQLGAGVGFGEPVVAEGKVFAPTAFNVAVYGILK
jgi:hypothetical protein